MRKTVEVSKLVDVANTMLASEGTSKEFRQGVILMIENVLFETGNYNGFRYLTNNELPEDIEPGVRYNGQEILPFEERFVNTDATRVMYSSKSDTYARWRPQPEEA